MSGNFDEIIIQLPNKAEYLSFMRLAVSGLLSRIGFDIDTIEDMKVVVTEICSRIVSSDCESDQQDYSVKFRLAESGFQAFFRVSKCLASSLFEGDSGEFAKAIISSLTDEFSIKCEDDCIITIGKYLEDSVDG